MYDHYWGEERDPFLPEPDECPDCCEAPCICPDRCCVCNRKGSDITDSLCNACDQQAKSIRPDNWSDWDRYVDDIYS